MYKIIWDSLPNKFDSVLIIIFRDNEILYVKNKKRLWEITGGKRDDGERIIDTASREAYEEGGIIINKASFKTYGYYILDNGHITIISSAEISHIKGIPIDSEIEDRTFYNKPMSKKLLSFKDDLYNDIFNHLGWPHEQ